MSKIYDIQLSIDLIQESDLYLDEVESSLIESLLEYSSNYVKVVVTSISGVYKLSQEQLFKKLPLGTTFTVLIDGYYKIIQHPYKTRPLYKKDLKDKKIFKYVENLCSDYLLEELLLKVSKNKVFSSYKDFTSYAEGVIRVC